MMYTKKRQSRAGGIVGEISLLVLCIVFIAPVYIVLVNSFKSRAEITNNPLGLPASFTLEYYKTAIERMNFFSAFKNSVIITVCSIVLIVVFTAMTAWKLARDNSKKSNFIFFFFVSTMIIPFQSVMMPLMQWLGILQRGIGIKLLDTHYGLIFLYLGFSAGMSVFLYHGFVKGIPISLEEAALIDGCNQWQIFWKITFPIMKPTTVTVIILNMVSIWNDFLLPSLIISSKNLRTIPLSTYSFFGEYTIQWNMAMAGLMMTIIPILIFYVFSQKYIIKGMVSGSVK